MEKLICPYCHRESETQICEHCSAEIPVEEKKTKKTTKDKESET